jgi:Tol biopolymer transport system component
VPGAEVTPVSGARVFPFWSPDSQYIAFASAGKLKKVNISGGAPKPFATSACACRLPAPGVATV